MNQSIRRYENRAVDTGQVIEGLISLAKDFRSASAPGEKFGITED